MQRAPSLMLIVIVVIVILAIIAIASQYPDLFEETTTAPPAGGETAMTEEVMVTDGMRHTVPLEDIVCGITAIPPCPKDAIPPIDNPRFISIDDANQWLADDEPGLGLAVDGIARFYPFQILVWHEMVNDEFNGRPVLVTYCPLCLTGIAFDPVVNGQAAEFGTSGKLWNSNLVMYDRQTDSYWSQITGEAIAGPLAGAALKKIPVDTTTYGAWKALHPDTQVLSRDTGFTRVYGVDPYGGYSTSGSIYFPVDNEDDRLPPKAVVYALNLNGQQKAYPHEEVAKAGIVNDEFAGKALLVIHDTDLDVIRVFGRTLNGEVLEFELADGKILDTRTGSEWNTGGKAVGLPDQQLEQVVGEISFWFAWAAVYPETEIFFAETSD